MLIDQQGSLTVVAHPLAQWIEAETEVKDDLMDGVGPLLTGQFGASLHLKLHVAQSRFDGTRSHARHRRNYGVRLSVK